VFSGNSAIQGGGIFNCDGTVAVHNSLITNNTAGEGGGIFNCPGGTTTLRNTLVRGNEPDDIAPAP
jgi:predicted outer membrane repeat protein